MEDKPNESVVESLASVNHIALEDSSDLNEVMLLLTKKITGYVFFVCEFSRTNLFAPQTRSQFKYYI